MGVVLSIFDGVYAAGLNKFSKKKRGLRFSFEVTGLSPWRDWDRVTVKKMKTDVRALPQSTFEFQEQFANHH